MPVTVTAGDDKHIRIFDNNSGAFCVLRGNVEGFSLKRFVRLVLVVFVWVVPT